MNLTRRQVIQGAAALAVSAAMGPKQLIASSPAEKQLIIDTHQHLWDLSKLKIAWLKNAPEPRRQRHSTEEYRQAVEGLNVRAVYIEVDADDAVAEAESIVELCRSKQAPTLAAVIGGRPASDGFAEYIRRFNETGVIRGVRQVLHSGGTPRGFCLQEKFVAGVRLLGELGLSFDLCMRPGELADGAKLAELAPETRFVVDHCGNADPAGFISASTTRPSHDPELWKRDMTALAARPNVICKISGIVAGAPEQWSADHLAPIVNYCLDTFGPDRVVFGGDWPICLKRATLKQWIEALNQIVSNRAQTEQRKLWSENAIRFYRLTL